MPYNPGNLISPTASGTHALVTATLPAAPVDSRWMITSIIVSYAGTVTNGGVTIISTDGVTPTTILDVGLLVGAQQFRFNPPLPALPGQSVTANLADGGSAVVGKVNVQAFIQ